MEEQKLKDQGHHQVMSVCKFLTARYLTILSNVVIILRSRYINENSALVEQ